MKNLINKYIVLFIAACFIMVSCEDWTKVEADIIDVPGKSDDYYANLRAWKATALDRQVSFGWFGGWTGEGSSLVSCLIGLPDSMDVVSIWGPWVGLSEAQKRDLEYVQRVKGLKVMACAFTENVGDGFTPAGETVKGYWGWDPSESALNAEPTEAQAEAIRKYARAIADTVIFYGYDGFDMDHEPNYGGSGDLASSRPRLRVFIDELSKYFGPMSGTGRFLAVDGEPQSIPKEVGPCFTWFIVQAYDCTTYTNLNSRLNTTINNYSGVMTPAEVAAKYIVTENFEKSAYNTTGGAVFRQEDGTTVRSYIGMAAWQPLIGGQRLAKGGSGTYHMEYSYSPPGYSGLYPFVRQTIQIMNPSSDQ